MPKLVATLTDGWTVDVAERFYFEIPAGPRMGETTLDYAIDTEGHVIPADLIAYMSWVQA